MGTGLTIPEEFERLLPDHKCSLTISHNEHKDSYMTLSEWLECVDVYDWATEEQKQRAIDADDFWVIHWYPETPIGFHALAAPTLQEAIEALDAEHEG